MKIICEYNKLSKQGKFNLHYYIIHVSTLLILLILTLYTARWVITLELKTNALENRLERLERIYQIDKMIKKSDNEKQ